MRVVIAGGGTGGHLYPGLALAQAVLRRHPEADILFIGTERGLESRVVPAHGFALYTLSIRGLQRSLSMQNLLFPFRLAGSFVKSVLKLLAFKPDLVIGTGGYVAGPPLFAAKLLRIPAVIQEQNSYPGLVNRLLGKRVDAVFLTFAAARPFFAGQKNIFITGNPVLMGRAQKSREQSCQELGFDPARKTLLVFGGSQGAKRINEIVAGALAQIFQLDDVQIIWIVGPAWQKTWQHLEAEHGGRLRVLGYVDDMASVYNLTDLAVCRAGAMTISELTLFGIPAIYIPLPGATADHQTANARAVVAAGGGLMAAQSELSAEKLAALVTAVLTDEKKLQALAQGARELARPNAAEEIISRCEKVVALRKAAQ